MDLGRKNNSKTELLSGAEALEIAQAQHQKQQARRTGSKKGNGKSNQELKLSKAHDAGVSKSKHPKKTKRSTEPDAEATNKSATANGRATKSKQSTTTTPTSEKQFYEEDGLRIPLCDAKGQKKQYARDGQVLAQKFSKAILCNIVKEYAGESKVEELKATNASKKQIAQWIQDVETRAWGKGPRQQAARETLKDPQRKASVEVLGAPQPQELVKKNKSGGTKTKEEPRANPNTNDTMSLNGTSNGGKRKRDDERVATQTPKKTKYQHHGTQNVTTSAPQETKFSGDSNKAHINPPQDRGLLQPMNTSNPPKSAGYTQQQRVKQKKSDNQRLAKKRADEQANMAFYIVKINDKHKMKEHPFIDACELNPTWDPATSPETPSTKVQKLAYGHKVILTATSDNTVHETTISLADLKAERQRQRQFQQRFDSPAASDHQKEKQVNEQPCSNNPDAPYRKPGKHGWDYDKHCWAWEGDPDLHTGIGHQIDPEDLAKLEQEGVQFQREFDQKYPGRLDNQWPCGCQVPGDDDDSEEE